VCFGIKIVDDGDLGSNTTPVLAKIQHEEGLEGMGPYDSVTGNRMKWRATLLIMGWNVFPYRLPYRSDKLLDGL
jgi:hypothetical protein